MKFALAELRKHGFPYFFEEEIDLSSDLKGVEDILDIKDTKVVGTINLIDNNSYKVDLKIETTLILESSISLKEITYPLEIEVSEIYSTIFNDDYFLIEGQTLDTKEAVITNILVSKPMSICLDGEEFISDEVDEPQEEKINEAFKSLKDLL